jgi:hypothetical protein
MPISDWARKNKYTLKNSQGHTITWDDSKTHVLLWVNKKPYKFPNVTRAVEVYDKSNNRKRPENQTDEEWWADYDKYLEANSE